jgi:BlaI family penicillinase repressor
MAKTSHLNLTRRERQIMDILYRRGRATAGDVMADMTGNPNYSTVRAQLRVMEEKGHVRHEEVGLRYVYIPMAPRHQVRQSALKHLVDTFFEGSTHKVVAALLGAEGAKVSDEELDRISELVEKATRTATSAVRSPHYTICSSSEAGNGRRRSRSSRAIHLSTNRGGGVPSGSAGFAELRRHLGGRYAGESIERGAWFEDDSMRQVPDRGTLIQITAGTRQTIELSVLPPLQ